MLACDAPHKLEILFGPPLPVLGRIHLSLGPLGTASAFPIAGGSPRATARVFASSANALEIDAPDSAALSASHNSHERQHNVGGGLCHLRSVVMGTGEPGLGGVMPAALERPTA